MSDLTKEDVKKIIRTELQCFKISILETIQSIMVEIANCNLLEEIRYLTEEVEKGENNG